MRLAVLCALIGMTRAAVADDAELPTIESALPPVIRIGADRETVVRRVELDVRGAPEVTWLRIETSTWSMATVSIDLPRGARVLGMSTTHGGDVVWAQRTVDAVGDAAVHRDDITAVVQHRGTSADEEHLRLRVAPHVSKGTDCIGCSRRGVGNPRAIDLALALPALDQLAIDPGPSRGVKIALAGAAIAARPGQTVRLDVHALAGVPAREPQAAFEIAGDGPPSDVIVDVFDSVTEVWSVGPRDIRRTIRLHEGQLRRCYMVAAQRDPSLAGTATLHVRIAPDGGVRSATTDGDLPPEVTGCLSRVAEAFDFPQTTVDAGDVLVNYPLTFRLR